MWDATNTLRLDAISLGAIGTFLGIVIAIITIYKFVLFIIDRRDKKKTNQQNDINLKLEQHLRLKNALKKFDIENVEILNELIKTQPGDHYSLTYINQRWCDFREELEKVITYEDLASEETKWNLAKFTGVFEPNDLFKHRITDLKSPKGGYVVPSRIPPSEFDLGTRSYVLKNIDKGCVEKYLQDAERLSEYYKDLISAIDKDIDSLKAKLAKLVNH